MRNHKPWRVVRVNELGGGPETGHNTRATAYHKVQDEIRRIRDGKSRAVEIRVYWWDSTASKWHLNETLHRRDIAPETTT